MERGKSKEGLQGRKTSAGEYHSSPYKNKGKTGRAIKKGETITAAKK